MITQRAKLIAYEVVSGLIYGLIFAAVIEGLYQGLQIIKVVLQ